MGYFALGLSEIVEKLPQSDDFNENQKRKILSACDMIKGDIKHTIYKNDDTYHNLNNDGLEYIFKNSPDRELTNVQIDVNFASTINDVPSFSMDNNEKVMWKLKYGDSDDIFTEDDTNLGENGYRNLVNNKNNYNGVNNLKKWSHGYNLFSDNECENNEVDLWDNRITSKVRNHMNTALTDENNNVEEEKSNKIINLINSYEFTANGESILNNINNDDIKLRFFKCICNIINNEVTNVFDEGDHPLINIHFNTASNRYRNLLSDSNTSNSDINKRIDLLENINNVDELNFKNPNKDKEKYIDNLQKLKSSIILAHSLAAAFPLDDNANKNKQIVLKSSYKKIVF